MDEKVRNAAVEKRSGKGALRLRTLRSPAGRQRSAPTSYCLKKRGGMLTSRTKSALFRLVDYPLLDEFLDGVEAHLLESDLGRDAAVASQRVVPRLLLDPHVEEGASKPQEG